VGRGLPIGYCIALTLLFAGLAEAQQIDVYTTVPSSEIKVESSSEFPGFPDEETVNGSGMTGHSHISHNLGKTMWISNISETATQARPQTRKGVVWVVYTFRKKIKPDFIEIWNHNQHDHTNRGLKKVYLEYSNDGINWATIQNGDLDYFFIHESKGRRD
jgi:alpha-mannosidase